MLKRYVMIALSMAALAVLAACTPSNYDMIPPEIDGAVDITYTIGRPLPDYLDGVSAEDRTDGDVTDTLTVDDSDVNYDVPGVYEVRYTATDDDGYSITVTISVFVIQGGTSADTVDPTIFGTNDITYVMGDPDIAYLEGVLAYDDRDGMITERLVVDDTAVDYGTPGTYDVTYSVTDDAGNTRTITITVRIVSTLKDIGYLSIYYINDVHGAFLENDSEIGFERMGSVIIDEKETNPDETLFIAGGDILQGQVISNYFDGASGIDALNVMDLDAFVIGNHEFDWGLEVVTSYRNPESAGVVADFPFLGANIFLKGTRTIPDFIDPYVIIDKGDIKVGIIGVMGYGLEGSIANSRVEDYMFAEPVAEVALHAEHLRTNEDVDVVLAVLHGADNSFNQAVGTLSGDQRVDAVFNGHSHQAYTTFISREGTDMPVIQSGGNGERLGHVRLEIDASDMVSGYLPENLRTYDDPRLSSYHPAVTAALAPYLEGIQVLLDDVIITAGQSVDKFTLTTYMAKVMRMAVDADIAFHNSGGTRASITNGQDITVATLYQIFPFDNRIKTVELKGSVIKSLLSDSYYAFNDIRPGLSFDDNTYYTVATNDYVFDYPEGVFIHGENIIDTGILIRDVLEDVLRNMALSHDTFLLSHPVVLDAMMPGFMTLQTREAENRLFV